MNVNAFEWFLFSLHMFDLIIAFNSTGIINLVTVMMFALFARNLPSTSINYGFIAFTFYSIGIILSSVVQCVANIKNVQRVHSTQPSFPLQIALGNIQTGASSSGSGSADESGSNLG